MRKTLFFILTLFTALTCLGVPTGFAQNGTSDHVVRLIYFLPRGNTPHPNINEKLDQVLKDTQKFYADEMERHGFGRKTFNFQTDRRGNAVMSHVNGRFRDAHYLTNSWEKVWQEIEGRFNRSQNIYLVVMELSGETNLCGNGNDRDAVGGDMMIHINCLNFEVTAHEFGHAFGLEHDFHSDTYIMSYGAYRDELSPCHAEWLNVHRYFNGGRASFNSNTEVEMSPPAASPLHAIRLRFAVNDPDGLHQAQLFTPATDPSEAPGFPKVLGCRSLRGQSDTAEFVTTELAAAAGGEESKVMLQVMDVHGNFTAREFPIDVTHLLPRGKVVSIPDTNLAAVVKETLGLAPRAPITQLDMLKLTSLEASERQITDLTGLEQAIHLKSLHLWGNQIRDLTPLAELTSLRSLFLGGNQISDITPIFELPYLIDLDLAANPIHNYALIARLTRLRFLDLSENQIQDVSFLAKLTQLQTLGLGANQISDITPLTGLRELENLNLAGNQISDITPLTGLTKLLFLALDGNPILDTAPIQTLRQNNPDLRLDAGALRLEAGPKIEGPWLWMIVSTGQRAVSRADASWKDWLATASKGSVTEQQIATAGATAGDRVKNKKWTLGRLSPTSGDNINEVVNATNLAKGTIDNHVAYGSIILDSPRKQNTRMYAGSDDNHKVWLNGELVHEQLDWYWAHDYQESFPVTLKKGKNVLLVAVQDGEGGWGGYFGFENGTVYNIIGDTLGDVIRKDPVEAADIETNLDAAGPKIEGPWLWMIVPTAKKDASEVAASGKDYLAAASKGSVTEEQIATEGAISGERVKNRSWTLGKLAPTGEDNITEIVNAIGLKKARIINHHVAYGSIALHAPRKQNTRMYAGSDDAVKVWLNGKLVHNNPADRAAYDYQESFPVTLKKGKNTLLVAVYNGWWAWSGFFGFTNDAAYSLLTTPIVHTASAQRPPMYWINAESGTLHRLVGAEVEDLVPGIQNAMSLTVDSTGNRIYWTEQTGKNSGNIKRANLDGSNVQLLTTLQSVPTSIAIDAAESKLYWTDSSGRIQYANLAGRQIRTLIRNLKSPGNITVDATGGKLYWTEASGRIRRANLNGKGIQNIASNLDPISDIAIGGTKIYWTEAAGESSGKIGRANLNGSNFGTLVSFQHVPSSIAIDPVGNKLYWTDTDGNIKRANLSGKDIQSVVSGLSAPAPIALGVRSAPAAILAAPARVTEIPSQTALLANYPNPFNPETWIPYQLAEPSDVKITIYDTRGVVVRHLDLRHQLAGTYTGRSGAAYWDGRNALGEPVASGVYFYTLTAGDFSATRRMLILK